MCETMISVSQVDLPVHLISPFNYKPLFVISQIVTMGMFVSKVTKNCVKR